jgi:hypothetical protein
MRLSIASLAAFAALVSAVPASADQGAPGTTFPEQPPALVPGCAAVLSNPGTQLGGVAGTHLSGTANAITLGLDRRRLFRSAVSSGGAARPPHPRLVGAATPAAAGPEVIPARWKNCTRGRGLSAPSRSISQRRSSQPVADLAERLRRVFAILSVPPQGW